MASKKALGRVRYYENLLVGIKSKRVSVAFCVGAQLGRRAGHHLLNRACGPGLVRSGHQREGLTQGGLSIHRSLNTDSIGRAWLYGRSGDTGQLTINVDIIISHATRGKTPFESLADLAPA
jgi:hypothetical protein